MSAYACRADYAFIGNGRCLPHVVIRDDAFPLQSHLMKPYPYHTKTKEKQVYNLSLSRARHLESSWLP